MNYPKKGGGGGGEMNWQPDAVKKILSISTLKVGLLGLGAPINNIDYKRGEIEIHLRFNLTPIYFSLSEFGSMRGFGPSQLGETGSIPVSSL